MATITRIMPQIISISEEDYNKLSYNQKLDPNKIYLRYETTIAHYDLNKKIVYKKIECESCGASMEVNTNNTDFIKCPYCGTSYYNSNKYTI